MIVIHLESFQQFLIGMKVDGQEVTPFLNSLYHNKSTISFSNFFNQVGLGKTSDAENMLETSTFGLPTGSLFSSLGTDNTFQGAPAILNQIQGYSSAVFHGGSGGFWNRNNVYKGLGYQYFFDGNFYDHEATPPPSMESRINCCLGKASSTSNTCSNPSTPNHHDDQSFSILHHGHGHQLPKRGNQR